jgi:hypothetical protein
MKRSFVVLGLVTNAQGELFKDDDGAHYYAEHDHTLFKNEDGTQKEFASPVEVYQAIADYNAGAFKVAGNNMMVKVYEPFKGKFIIEELHEIV